MGTGRFSQGMAEGWAGLLWIVAHSGFLPAAMPRAALARPWTQPGLRGEVIYAPLARALVDLQTEGGASSFAASLSFI